MRPRHPAWKILCGLAAAALLGIAAFFAWVQAVAARRWAELERRIPELITQARARDPRRPVLRGTAVPGNAWEDYNQALMVLGAVKSSELGDFVHRAPKADRGKVEAALAAHGAALDFLRAGVRKTDGTYPLKFEKGFSADMPGFLQSQNLTNLAVCKARFLVEEGRAQEAVDLLVDAAQFGGDLGRNTMVIGEMISIALMGAVLDELQGMALDPTTRKADWVALGRSLEILDGSFPDHGEAMLNEATMAAAGLADPAMAGQITMSAVPSALVAWRYGFSTRLMILDAVDTHLDLMRRVAAASGASWAEAREVAKEIDAELKVEKNPIAAMIIPGLLGAGRAVRERRAQLRLLRTAVAVRAGELLPELDDPFGGKLFTDGAKVWSVGADGVDGGGVGIWQPQGGSDIVLELRPK